MPISLDKGQAGTGGIEFVKLIDYKLLIAESFRSEQ